MEHVVAVLQIFEPLSAERDIGRVCWFGTRHWKFNEPFQRATKHPDNVSSFTSIPSTMDLLFESSTRSLEMRIGITRMNVGDRAHRRRISLVGETCFAMSSER